MLFAVGLFHHIRRDLRIHCDEREVVVLFGAGKCDGGIDSRRDSHAWNVQLYDAVERGRYNQETMNIHGVHFPEDQLADFCRRHGVKKLSVFGSILRDDFSPRSDVDMLVEFEPGRTPGIIGFGGMILELSRMIGRPVDLRTPFDLSRHLRAHVLRQARLLHAA